MHNKDRKIKNTIVNKYKLIYVPLFIGLIAIILISAISYYTSKNLLLSQMKQDGINLAKQTAFQVEENAISLQSINKMIDDKIRVVLSAAMLNEKSINNDFLKKISTDLNVDEINYFSSKGEVLFSNIDEYVGRFPSKDHPVHIFRLSGLDGFIENVRKDSESNNYNKYGYLRSKSGAFIQVGIRSTEIESMTYMFNYQNLVEKLTQNDNIINVLFIDKNLKTIAISSESGLGLVHDTHKEIELQQALTGIISTKYFYDKKADITSLTIYVPVLINGEINNALVICLSTEKVYSNIYMNFVKSTIIAIIMLLIIFFVQDKNVIKPVRQLGQDIEQIDMEKNTTYRLPLVKGDAFYGLVSSINNILDKTDSYFNQIKEHQEELQASNEEISAAYGELSATDEELRAQYDEIQNYTEALEDLKEKYEIAIEGTNSAVWEFNLETETIFFSEGFKNILGVHIKEKLNIHKIFNELLSKEDVEILVEKFVGYKNNSNEEIYDQFKIKDSAGNSKWVLIRGKCLLNKKNKSLNLINGIMLDITQIKEHEEYIQHMAYHDSLTNLPNRRKFIKTLEKQLNDNRFGAVILLDLDNFKGINDTLGHNYGDKVLKKVSEVLNSINVENMFVSRFGGDEFFILLKDEKDIVKIEDFVKTIINIFTNKLLVEGEMIYISCSIGITLYPFDSNDVNQLLMNADMSMYKVKNSGKNNYMFFNVSMTESLQVQIKIEKILRDAIEQNNFKLLYQPQICSFTGSLIGFEALLRLKTHNISPADFIPVAEETGAIMEIGRWVTRETIKQIATWRDKGLGLKPIAINFSAKQLNDFSYVSFLKQTLQEFNVDARYIDIEITESIFLEKKDETIKFLEKLKALGVKIALDDFGTGYSSLSYLTFLPVDKIKLDKSLNDKFLELENVKVMDSLISLAHSLNLEVVAEGIEDISHFNRLKIAGCNYIQGYLFSKPLESFDAEKIYNDNFLDKLIIENTTK